MYIYILNIYLNIYKYIYTYINMYKPKTQTYNMESPTENTVTAKGINSNIIMLLQ